MAKKLAVSPLAPPDPAPPLAVRGVRCASTAAGIRYVGRPDLLLVELAPETQVAGVLTRSATPGHPVTWCRKALPQGRARALVVNAGNANVCRGAEGDAAVAREVAAVVGLLGCAAEEVLIASTGVIGERLAVERIEAALPALMTELSAETDAVEAAARTIMTTDTFAKWVSRRLELDGKTSDDHRHRQGLGHDRARHGDHAGLRLHRRG